MSTQPPERLLALLASIELNDEAGASPLDEPMIGDLAELVGHASALRELLEAVHLLDLNNWFDADRANPEIETGKAGVRSALAKLQD